MASQHSPPIEADIQVFGSCVITKGSCVDTAINPSREEHVADVMPTMGLYVQDDHSTCLVALGKVYEGVSTIHNLPYVDDVIKVSVGKVYKGNTQVLFPTLEIQYVRQNFDTFIVWPAHLIKPISHEIFIYV